MKIIDLLNKIANGEEVPKYIRYRDISKHKYNNMMVCKENIIYQLDQCVINLNDEVEILEEEKKIPEKVDFDISNFSYKEYELNIMRNNVIANTKAINQIIDYLDYLKSKGE